MMTLTMMGMETSTETAAKTTIGTIVKAMMATITAIPEATMIRTEVVTKMTEGTEAMGIPTAIKMAVTTIMTQVLCGRIYAKYRKKHSATIQRP
jgi:hypothetical protein